MRKVATKDALGLILCHDLTEIIPGVHKGAAFKKGHIVREEDIPRLLSMGKDHLYVWKDEAGLVHENEAGRRLAALVNNGSFQEVGPREGKVDLLAGQSGLFRINREVITRLNMIGEVVISTLPDYSYVAAEDQVAGMRVIPLAINEKKLEQAESIAAAADWISDLKPLKIKKAGLIVTGNEVYYRRIEDKFGPKVTEKLAEMGVELAAKTVLPDSAAAITEELLRQRDGGAEMLLVSGGMSVDPDDVTPTAIRDSGARVVTYGTPVFPGAMFMLAYLGDVPVMGLPGCVMHSPVTVFDKLLPRVLAGEKVSDADIAAFGVGGLCRSCDTCHYPNCGFGTC